MQAQQDMALWAMLMFFATMLTVAITGFGLLLLKRTLDATLNAINTADRTNEISQGMVEESQKATAAAVDAAKAGRDANKIARDSSERQLRAYVGISGLGVPLKGEGRVLVVEWRNSGQTPANDLVANLTALGPDEKPIGSVDVQEKEFGTVPMNLPITMQFGIDRKTLMLANEEKTDVVWEITWTYRDVFKKKRKGTAIISSEPDQLANGAAGVKKSQSD